MPKLSETPSEKSAARSTGSEAASSALLSPEFSLEQRRSLLSVAHSAILHACERGNFSYAKTGQKTHLSFLQPPISLQLSDLRGVFTTLYLDHALRGCVGYALPVVPLYQAVAETACAAAFEDSRFVPVGNEEALRLRVSLSVLSRLAPIRPEAVEIGRHGLVISQGSRRGLLLPQVPVEHDWDRDTFLEQTCRKAGLPLDAWRGPAAVEAFTAEVFSDADVDSDAAVHG